MNFLPSFLLFFVRCKVAAAAAALIGSPERQRLHCSIIFQPSSTQSAAKASHLAKLRHLNVCVEEREAGKVLRPAAGTEGGGQSGWRKAKWMVGNCWAHRQPPNQPQEIGGQFASGMASGDGELGGIRGSKRMAGRGRLMGSSWSGGSHHREASDHQGSKRLFAAGGGPSIRQTSGSAAVVQRAEEEEKLLLLLAWR